MTLLDLLVTLTLLPPRVILVFAPLPPLAFMGDLEAAPPLPLAEMPPLPLVEFLLSPCRNSPGGTLRSSSFYCLCLEVDLYKCDFE